MTTISEVWSEDPAFFARKLKHHCRNIRVDGFDHEAFQESIQALTDETMLEVALLSSNVGGTFASTCVKYSETEGSYYLDFWGLKNSSLETHLLEKTGWSTLKARLDKAEADKKAKLADLSARKTEIRKSKKEKAS